MWRGSEAGEEGAKMPARKEMAQRDPLPHAELQDVIDLALWAGQMLLQHGRARSGWRRPCITWGPDWAAIGWIFSCPLMPLS